MDVRNCKDCGKLFNYIGGAPLCQTCLKKLDDKFVQVKESRSRSSRGCRGE